MPRTRLNLQVKLERTHRQKNKTKLHKNKRDQLLDRKKPPSVYIKKLLIHKAAIKPTPSYGMEMWGCASKCKTVVMQRSQSKILRTIENAPHYITNHTVHTDINILYVSDVFHERNNKHHNSLQYHSNPLLESLLQIVNNRRLNHVGL
jgi:hypothetical protein